MAHCEIAAVLDTEAEIMEREDRVKSPKVTIPAIEAGGRREHARSRKTPQVLTDRGGRVIVPGEAT